MRINLVCVNYFGCQDTLRFLESIKLPPSAEMFIVIVDNSESAEEWSLLKSEIDSRDFSRAISLDLVRSSENSGYMGGCNLGRARSDFEPGDVTILCNNDIEFHEDFFFRLQDRVELFARGVSLMAPDVIDLHTSNPLNPFLVNRPTGSQINKLRMIYGNYYVATVFHYLSLLRGKFRRAGGADILGEQDIYAAHGSVFVMGGAAWMDHIDDAYYMYAEEITIAEMVLNACGRVLYCPDLKVTHNSHASTGVGLSRRVFEWKKNAISYISKKYVWD